MTTETTTEPESVADSEAMSESNAGRADAVRSLIECIMVTVFALAIPAALLVIAWRLAPSGYGKGVVRMAGVTLAVIAVGAVVTVIIRSSSSRARRRRAQAMQGRCASCGYDLTGLSDSICPECGSENDHVRFGPTGVIERERRA